MGYEDTPIYANPQPHQNYAPPPNSNEYPNYTQPPPPSYSAAQPVFVAQPSYAPHYEPDHTHVVLVQPKENNMLFGCACGLFCGIFGLCCALAVNDKASYLKGWAIAFIILIIIGLVVGLSSAAY